MIKIGIVVPVYNAELYLENCISSVLDQSYSNIELVLVNDGSTDNSGKICDYYATIDKRVKVIHQKNHGVSFARYIGLTNVDCEYATFLDADDWIVKDAYENLLRYMNEGIDVISFQIIRYFDDSYQYTSFNNYQQGLYSKQQIEEKIFPTMIWDLEKGIYGIDPSICNKVIKKKLLLNELSEVINLKISYGEDVAVMYPLMLKAESLYITDNSSYYHRQRKGKEIASYFLDKNFYKKLYLLYEYLLEKCKAHIEFIKQIDYFYTYSVKQHLWIYGDKKREGELFPFDKIPKGSKIILYGASGVGQVYYEQFLKIKYGIILAWVDKNYDKYEQLGVKDIAYISTIEDFDYIVIAVNYQETAANIQRNLIRMGVDEDKIVWKNNFIKNTIV